MSTLFPTTPTGAVLICIAPAIAFFYLTYCLITKRRTSHSPLADAACRNLKPSNLTASADETSTTSTLKEITIPQEPSEISHLLQKTRTSTAEGLTSFPDCNSNLFFTLTPGNTLPVASSSYDFSYLNVNPEYGTTSPENCHTVVPMGMDVPRDANTTKGYNDSVKCVSSVWSNTSSIGVNDYRRYDNLLRNPENSDWREEQLDKLERRIIG